MTTKPASSRRRAIARTGVAVILAATVVSSGDTLATATDGALDTSFGTGGTVIASITSGDDDAIQSVVQADGKIVVVGSSNTGANTAFTIARFTATGVLDPSFSDDGSVTTLIGDGNAVASSVALQDDGKIIVAGVSADGTKSVLTMARYSTAGVLDNTFGEDGIVTTAIGDAAVASAITIQDDGKIVLAGYRESTGNTDFLVARYTVTGSLDPTFDSDGIAVTAIGSARDKARDVTVQADGKIVAVGETDNGSNDDFAVVRYTGDGVLDATFGADGIVTTALGSGNESAGSVALQADGRLIVAGATIGAANTDFAAARYTTTGSLDVTFDFDGIVVTPIGTGDEEALEAAIQADGRIILGGWSHGASNDNFAVARYTATGSLDAAFGTGGTTTTSFGVGLDSYMNGLAVQPDGKVVGVGSTYIDSHWEFSLARYTAPTPVFGIASVYPSSGPVVGGTRLTVTGRGFSTAGIVKVTVGGRPCAGVSVVSSTRLVCTAPAGRSGSATVKVTNPTRQSTSRSRAFTYLARLALPDTYWTQQFGSTSAETPTAIEIGPGGDLWVYGTTKGVLAPGASNSSNKEDLFLARYSKSGAQRWVMQFGTAAVDTASQRIVVLSNGDAVVTGTTKGAMPGSGRDGARTDSDVFLARISKSGTLTWVKQWGTTGQEEAWSLDATKTGDIYVSAEVDSAVASNLSTPNAHGGADDGVVLRFDRAGNLKWARQFGGPDNEYTWDIAVAKSGAIYVAGTTSGDLDGPTGTLCSPSGCAANGLDDGFLVRLNSAGSIEWARQEGSSGYDEMYGVAVGPSGDVYFAGFTDGTLSSPGTNSIRRGTRTDYDGVVERWSPTGVRKWANQHGTNANDQGWYLEVAPNGEAFFSGFTSGQFAGYENLGDWDAYIMRVSGAGIATAVRQFSTEGRDTDTYWGSAIALAPSNSIVLTTTTTGTTWGQLKTGGADSDVSLTMLPRPGAATGGSERRWVSQFGSSEIDGTAASGSDAKGNVYVYGVTNGAIERGDTALGTTYDVFVSKHDPYGNLLWVRQFGTVDGELAARQMAVRPNGDVYVTGSTWGTYGTGAKPGGEGNRDVFIAKLNSSGVLQWFKLWGNDGTEHADAITAAPNGDLYLALRTSGVLPSGSLPTNAPSGGWDAGIAKFDKNGNFKWARQFGSAQFDTAAGVTVTKWGEIFVSGTAYGSIGDADAALPADAESAGFVAKFDKIGNRAWVRLYGGVANKRTNFGPVVAASDGSVYAAGFTSAGLSDTNRGGLDGVVYRIERDSSVRWVNQHGGTTDDSPMAAVVAKNGALYVVGVTEGAISPFANQGFWDVYVVGISPDGTDTRVRQWGTPLGESYWYETPAIAARPDGRLVVSTDSASVPWGARASRGSSDIVVTAVDVPVDTASVPG